MSDMRLQMSNGQVTPHIVVTALGRAHAASASGTQITDGQRTWLYVTSISTGAAHVHRDPDVLCGQPVPRTSARDVVYAVVKA